MKVNVDSELAEVLSDLIADYSQTRTVSDEFRRVYAGLSEVARTLVPPAIAALMASCAPEPIDCHGSFRLEHSFTHGEDAQAAVDRWNAFVGRPVLELRPDGKCLIQEGPVEHDRWIAYYDNLDGSIRIDPDRVSDVEIAIMHEMGHSLGLEHVSDGIMNPYEYTEDFTEEDAAECHRVGVCGE